MRKIPESQQQMQIIIPTRGRVGNQVTLKNLSPKYRSRTILFCPLNEADAHREHFPDIRVIDHATDMTISKKRELILRECFGLAIKKILMLDDDLFFYVRRDDVPDRLRDATFGDVDLWFDEMSTLLEKYAHAGFGPRQGNHVQPSGWLECGRAMLALGYRVDIVQQFELGRIETREDMDLTLQLLRSGYKNAITHEFAVGQKSYNAPGGCSDERTTESSNADAYRLMELHPGFVSVVDRQYKNSPRKEVICHWKKAYKSSLNGQLHSHQEVTN